MNSVIPGESEDLASRLQSSRQRVSELERTLSAVSTQQKQVDRVSPASDPPGWRCSFPDRGRGKVPSTRWSVFLPTRQHGLFLAALKF